MSTESPILNTNPGPAPQPAEERPPHSRAELWLMRARIALVVVFFIELGMVLIVLPWTTLWTDNRLLIMRPALRALLMHGFVRGALSGLGLINVWIGIWEAVHYTEKN